ncbi:uncharacterized protein LOC131827857 [Mustela lutreola]|uniref:uncharacterized protein LOC131827857 n=1 Tax=Mustela lutreola TaxID=9666 RepID=UPI0027970E1C|nr:uncharacterized protein LOC131827857 [Mustela lutreola]
MLNGFRKATGPEFILRRGKWTGNSAFPASPVQTPGGAKREQGYDQGVTSCQDAVRGRLQGSAYWGGIRTEGVRQGVKAKHTPPILMHNIRRQSPSRHPLFRLPHSGGAGAESKVPRPWGSDPKDLRRDGEGRWSGWPRLPGHSVLPTSSIPPATFDLASRTHGGQGGDAQGIPLSIHRRASAAFSLGLRRAFPSPPPKTCSPEPTRICLGAHGLP